MSTKKVTQKGKVLPTQTYKGIKPNEQKSLKKIAKKVAEEHQNCPKPTLLVKKSDLKKAEDMPKVEQKTLFHIWDVYGVRYFLDEANVPTRRVKCIPVTSDHDTANEPELRNSLITEAEQKLIDMGFFMTDVDAMESALKETEPVLDHIRHDIKYGDVCQKCAADRLGTIIDWMEYLRSWRNRRFALAEMLGGTCNLPPIIPNDYEENWHIDEEKHALVHNVPVPSKVHAITVSGVKGIGDLPKVFDQLKLPKEALDELNNTVKKITSAPPKKVEQPKK